MNAAPPFDVLCAGIVVADHVADPVERLPAPGELVLTDATRLTVGGCASNVAVDLARLGLRSAVAGCIGDDGFGRFVGEFLTAAGVNGDHLEVRDDAPTSTTIVLNTTGEDRRFLHCVGANALFTGESLDERAIRAARVLYLGGFGLAAHPSAEHVARLFRRARSAGVVTVLDVVVPERSDLPERLRRVLPLTDLFLPNDDEARLLCGLDEPLDQAAHFRDLGAGTVVVTGGAHGAVLIDDENRLRTSAFPVDFVDGTGSGDAFTAGFLLGLLEDRDVETRLRFGAALGASCVRGTGATSTVFDRRELEAFLESRELPIEAV